MSEEQPPSTNGSTGRSWLSRLRRAWGEEPQSRQDVVEMLDEAREHGVLDADEQAMLLGVLEVSEAKVSDIMVPRSQMVVLNQTDDPRTWLRDIVESGHSRFPVIGEDRDEVVGILLAKDLLKLFSDNEVDPKEALNLLRPAVFIPESKRLNTLLNEFRESHNHMAIVVDEYGGVAGLLTIEDVLEQIVGEIDDEHDDLEENIQPGENDGYIVRALTRIEDFNEHFGSALSDEHYDTVGGLIAHELGRIPRLGDEVQLAPFRFKVLSLDGRRVESVEAHHEAQEDGRLGG